jgi:cell division transport system ATP-binding protein
MITFEDVSAVYPGQLKPALNRVSVQIEKGEFVFLIGSSGSGKSTFMRLIRREQRATAGTVYVAGKDLNSMRQWRIPEFRRQIGTVFQDFRLLPGKSAWENIAFAMQVVGRPTKEIRKTVPEMIDMVGLTGLEDRAPEEMSGGEQQRVAIARAVVNRPKILLADEPTGNLDPTTAVGIMRLLDQINRRSSTTVIMATHDANVVDQMRRRVIELVDGQIVRDQARGVYGSD